MNSKIFTAAALLALVPALHAQAPPLPAAPAAPSSPAAPASAAVTLRYKFAVGQVRRYEYDMATQTLVQTGQAGAGVPINTTTKTIMRQTVKSVRPADGAATISTQIESLHTLVNGQEMPLPEAQTAKMKQPFSQVMLPNGKILSVDAPGLSAMGGPDMDFGRGLSNDMSGLPDGAVKVGDTWGGSGTMAMMGMNITAASTLAAVDQANGGPLATIQIKQTGTMDKAMTQGPVPMKMSGPITGQISEVFDISAGALQSAKGTTSMDMLMTFPKSAGGTPPPGMPSAMKMQMQMKYTMERLSDTPTPAQ